jgi:large subunit ribosomal protein L5
MNIIYIWYHTILRADLIYKLNLRNCLLTPKINCVSLNICLQSIVENPKTILYSLLVLKLVTGQSGSICKVKHSLSSFNIRKGMLLGATVNLRKNYMYEFLTLFILFVMPNLKKVCKLNKYGSLSIGIKSIFSFPQLISFNDKLLKNFGCIINITTINTSYLSSKLLLTGLQLPL